MEALQLCQPSNLCVMIYRLLFTLQSNTKNLWVGEVVKPSWMRSLYLSCLSFLHVVIVPNFTLGGKGQCEMLLNWDAIWGELFVKHWLVSIITNHSHSTQMACIPINALLYQPGLNPLMTNFCSSFSLLGKRWRNSLSSILFLNSRSCGQGWESLRENKLKMLISWWISNSQSTTLYKVLLFTKKLKKTMLADVDTNLSQDL